MIPNYLATGVAAMVVSAGILAWSALGLHRPGGPTVFLLLFVALTLVGGGVGHVPFFLVAWAWATRIHTDLTGWRVRLGRWRSVVARGWIPGLVASSGLFLLGLELSVFGYPPLAKDPDRLLRVIWVLLAAALVLMNVAFVAAIARDVEAAS